MYADIIIDITHEKLDKVFQYRVPEELEGDLRTGAGVIVPFGRGNRETKGYIVGFSETCDYDAEKIKDILRTDTSSVAIEARLVALAAWMKEYYGGTMIQALKTVLPIKRTEQQKEQRILKRCISREAGEKKLLSESQMLQVPMLPLCFHLPRHGVPARLPHHQVVY